MQKIWKKSSLKIKNSRSDSKIENAKKPSKKGVGV